MNIVIITNILSPYRRFFFDSISRYAMNNDINFSVVLMADTEKGRTWTYDDLKTEYTTLLDNKTLNIKDDIFIHFNKGLKGTLEKLRPDIVIVGGSYMFPSVWRSIQLQKKFNYKLLFWSESHLNSQKGYSGIKIKVRELIRNKLYKSFDGFCYAGKMSKELIDKYANNNAEMYFVPNLVQPEVFKKAVGIRESKYNDIRKKHSIDNDRYVFICPARLEKVKGIEEFIKIYSKVSQKSTILICGEGELYDDISNLISKVEDSDIRLLGSKSQEELVELYSISNCFLMPSLSDANPLTCIEALWAELPLLVSEHVGNYPEVIKDGENGYSFSYDNSDELVIKINRLINSNSQWRKNAEIVSREIVEKIYDPDKAVKNLIDSLVNSQQY